MIVYALIPPIEGFLGPCIVIFEQVDDVEVESFGVEPCAIVLCPALLRIQYMVTLEP